MLKVMLFPNVLRLIDWLLSLPFRSMKRNCGRSRLEVRLSSPLTIELLEVRLAMIAEGSIYSFSGVTVDTSAILGPISAQADWGDGSRTPIQVSASPTAGPFVVRFDYSLDTGQFFNTPEKQAILQIAADMVFSRFGDSLSAITPSATNRWEATFTDPATGAVISRPMGNLGANEFVIFVGTRDLPGNSVAVAGPGGTSWNGAADFGQTVLTRGQTGATGSNQTDFGPWGGSLTVDPNIDWHFGATTAGLTEDKYDFLSAISHEFMHILGFGVAPSWRRLVSSGQFIGSNSTGVNGGQAVPLDGDQAHWQEGTRNADQETLMDPSINAKGTRKLPTPLDFAGLADIGWNAISQHARVSGSHTYSDDGSYPIKFTFSGGRAGEKSTTVGVVNVENVIPSINQRGNLIAQVNVPINIVDMAVFRDAGFGSTETFESSINWGDGSPSQRGVATIDRPGSAGVATEGSFDGSHTYALAGSYNVTYRVTDDNGGFAESTFNIRVNEPPEIKLTLDRSEVSEAAGASAANLVIDTIGLDTSRENTLILVSNDPSEATLPSTVVIPIGITRVIVGVNAIDDALLDGPQSVQFTAQLGGLTSQPASIQVLDRELIRLALNVTQIREDGGAGAAVLRVSRSNTDVSNELKVTLASSNIFAATVPPSVTIPANAASIDVSVTAVDDSVIDGIQSVVFTPEATGYFGLSVAMSVQDYEPLQWVEQRISLAESPTSSGATVTIVLPAPAPSSGSVINLSTDLTGQLQFAPQVVVQAGQTTASVFVSAINDNFAESPQTVRIAASFPGMDSAFILIDLTDDDRSPWTNSNNSFDANGDGSLDPLDILQIINYAKRNNFGELLNGQNASGPPYVDVNGNGILEPLDILLVINALSRLAR